MPTSVRLRVKVGDITKTSGTDVPARDPVFSFNSENDGYDVFSRKVEEKVGESLQNYRKKTVRTDTSIYIKPSQTARQRDWLALTADNIASLIEAAYINYQKRTKDSSPFEIEVFVLAARMERRVLPGTRRATASRVQAASSAIDNYLVQRPELQMGEIARTHWSISQGRQPEGTPVTLPDSATFAQAQHIDSMFAEEKVEEESDLQVIQVQLNGSREMALTINVAELRRVLGLPNHNLLASGVFASFVPPPDPDEDVEDVDHMSD